MKILLTGANGFVGSHIVKALLHNDHEVIVLKRSFSDVRRIADCMNAVQLYDIDACDMKDIFQKQEGIDAIIHTATCYGQQGESGGEILDANVYFPLRLLECAHAYDVRLFINTDTFYTKCDNYDHLKGYILAKKHFVDWGKLYVREKKNTFINVKLEHVFGPHDNEFKFIPSIIKACICNEETIALTQGEQRRDFVYIDDVVSAYMAILNNACQKDCYYKEYEVGRGETLSIRECVEMVHRLGGSHSQLVFGALPYRSNEIMYSCADVSALRVFGWKPCVSIEQGLTQTVEDLKEGLVV